MLLPAGLSFDPDIVTCAQFMYISRFPRRLNQVQARRAFPLGALLGIVNLYCFDKGQPPMNDLIALKVLPESYESEIWHDPPPWVAPPAISIEYSCPALYCAVGLKGSLW